MSYHSDSAIQLLLFGRSLKHLINTLDQLRSLGVTLCSYHENLDFTTATGQLMFHLLAAFAEFERELIRERVKAGLANAMAKGKILRRPRRVVDPETVRELRENRLSLRAIAKTTGVSMSGMRRAPWRCVRGNHKTSPPSKTEILRQRRRLLPHLLPHVP